MSRADLVSLIPEMILCSAGVVLLLLDAFAPRLRRLFTPFAAIALGLAGWQTLALPAGTTFGGQLESSGATAAFALVVLLSALLALMASDGYLRRHRILSGEYHALMLWCTVGLTLMLRATELLTLFIALELFSLCLYTLAAFHRRIKVGTEAAIKYFLMGAFISSFILLGLALLYGQTGTTELAELAAAFSSGVTSPLAVLGMLLLVCGFGFKMSVVPFHAWSPDTYQGAPSPFVAFLSVAPKAASALVLIRILTVVAAGGAVSDRWDDLVALLAVLSMVVGNLLALVQRDIKRMLAYSGVAHMGYLLIALVGIERGTAAEHTVPVLVYLLAYALMNAGAFAAITLLYPHPGEEHTIAGLAGKGYRYPLLGVCLTVCMLSLGGIPPTAGFLGKYLVFLQAIETGHLTLAIVGVLASLIGVFYYLRVVYTLYMKAEPEGQPAVELTIDGWGRLATLAAAAGSLAVGVWPYQLLSWLLDGMGGFS